MWSDAISPPVEAPLPTLDVRVSERAIQNTATLLEAMKQMDRVGAKLLLVFQGDTFRSVVSIGDIQRALIKGLDLKTPVDLVLRPAITTASANDDLRQVRAKMLEARAEFMPVLTPDGELKRVLFWEDEFGEVSAPRSSLNLPIVIMAGGQGLRLKPLTNVIPKPLVPVGDTTMIERIIGQFRDCGANTFHVLANYKADLLQYYIRNAQSLQGLNVAVTVENESRGTVGGLSMLSDALSTTFIVTNCDVCIDQDYAEIVDYHRQNENLLTIVAAFRHYAIPYGILTAGANGELLSIQEKPENSYLANTGIYVLEPEVLEYIPAQSEFNVTDLIRTLRSASAKIGVFPISSGSWHDIGEWPEYLKTIASVRQK